MPARLPGGHDPEGAFATERSIEPDNYAAGTVNGQAINLNAKRGAIFNFQVGTVDAGGTVDGKLQASPDGSTGWADISGKTITQITASDGDGELLAFRAGEGGETDLYIRAVLTVAVNNVDASVGVITY